MVFHVSLIIITVFVLWGAVSPGNLAAVAENLLSITLDKFGWF
jgi:glycine betaine transporter